MARHVEDTGATQRQPISGDRRADADPERSTEPHAPGPAPLEPTALEDELRTLVGLRSRTTVRDRPLPVLAALLPPTAGDDREARFAAVQDLLEAAMADVSDPAHRAAAEALLGRGPQRWRPLTRRGAEAADAFGLGWDGYRRRRDATGVSVLQETIRELALAVERVAAARGSFAPSPVAPTTGDAVPLVRSVTSPAPVAPGRRPAPPRWALIGTLLGAVAVAVAAAGLVVLLRNADEGDAAGVRCGNLTHGVGDVARTADAELRAWVEPFRAAASSLPDASTRCAGLVERVGDHVLQRISAGDGPVETLVATTAEVPGDVVVLDTFERVAFDQAELDEPEPTRRLGRPVERADAADGVRMVTFTSGAIVREDADAPALAVTGELWERWQELGGLDGEVGRPLSAAYEQTGVGRLQEFTGGQLRADFVDGTLHWEPLTAAERTLPDGYRGSILVAETGSTSWFVDAEGVRHWLPTEVDYGCAVAAHDAGAIRGVPSAAIDALPAGEAFERCR